MASGITMAGNSEPCDLWTVMRSAALETLSCGGCRHADESPALKLAGSHGIDSTPTQLACGHDADGIGRKPEVMPRFALEVSGDEQLSERTRQTNLGQPD